MLTLRGLSSQGESKVINFINMDDIDNLHILDDIDNIEHMDKPFDKVISRMSKNQLIVLRAMLLKPESILSTREIAKKSGVVEKGLGGVLSALSRKQVAGEHLLEIMGRDSEHGLRFQLNSKALTLALADKQVRSLILSYKEK